MDEQQKQLIKKPTQNECNYADLEKMVADIMQKYFDRNEHKLSNKISSIEKSVIKTIDKQLGERISSLENK